MVNDKIYELAKQVGMIEFESIPGSVAVTPDYESVVKAKKFAELVIKECMTMCDETRADYFKHRKASDDFTDKNIYAEGEAASDIIKYKMKKHFGVEE